MIREARGNPIGNINGTPSHCLTGQRSNIIENPPRTGNPNQGSILSNAYYGVFLILSQLAPGGDARAQFQLCQLYYEGLGVTRNLQLAFAWCLKSAQQGFVEAMEWVGTDYDAGEGVTPNHALAVQWITKAAERGYQPAEEDLGAFYYFGMGGTQINPTLGCYWFRRAGRPDECRSNLP
ncbi:MAG: sel1 repeat family protein [Alphaproteobacteria bacterium]|nr:sel1 repeat family protein [Alphaproteobacteria bacterium]